MAQLVSKRYLVIHSLPQEDRYDTDDTSVGHNKAGQVVEVRRRMVFGGRRRFLRQWRLRQLGETLHTACMERW